MIPIVNTHIYEDQHSLPFSLPTALPKKQETSHWVPRVTAHILIVDRDPCICQSLARGTHNRGWSASTAQRVSEALTILSVHPPDLIITELLLRDKPGSDLIRALRSHSQFHTIPLIILSSLQSPLLECEGLALGANAYLTKPIRVSEVFEKILHLLHVSPSQGADLERGQ
jgi:DNA-binding response OmpR family regulator